MRSLFPALAFALAGCQSVQTTPQPIATSFDASEAGFIKKKGETKIEGHAFWRDDKGGTTNAAGEIVRLVPATSYSRERFAALYRGQRSIPANQISQAPSDPQYADYTRRARNRTAGSSSRASLQANISSHRRSGTRANQPGVGGRWRSAAFLEKRWTPGTTAAPCSRR